MIFRSSLVLKFTYFREKAFLHRAIQLYRYHTAWCHEFYHW